jgi:autotransporter-associated beta strand protein
MKHTSLGLQKATVLFAGILSAQLAGAATNVWIGASTPLTWANAGNWSLSAIPGAADVALFNNGALTNGPGAAYADSTVAANTLIQGLLCTNTAGYHNVLISPGATLTVSNLAAVDSLFVGGGVAVATTNTISGAGGSLVISNASGNINVRHGNTAVGTHRSTLDLSALGIFNASVARMLIAGDGGAPNPISREVGTLFLAKTNLITAAGAAPAISIGDNPSNGVGGGGAATNLWSFLYLGQTNAIFADSITIGRSKCAGSVAFSPSVINANAVAYVRGHTTSRIATLSIGDDSAQTTSNQPEFGSADFSGGLLDLMADVAYVGKGPNGTGNAAGIASGTLTLAAGTCDINTLEVGYQTYASATASPANGTVNVNGTASLVVNTSLRLANYVGGGAGVSQGTLNINGGTLTSKGGILAGGGNSTLSLVNATLNLTNSGSFVGTVVAPVGNVAITNSTLRLAVISGKTNIVAGNLAADGANHLQITTILGLSFPVQVPLIQYSGALAGAGFSSFTVTLPASYTGSLVNNSANGSIDLSITSGPMLLGPLTWSGKVSGVNNGNWDIGLTKDWLASGTPSVYQDSNPVTFDDTAAGATTVNLTAEVDPSSVTVSNSSLTYTFSGVGGIGGLCGLDKEGSGALILDESGGNTFTGASVFNNGTVQVGAYDGNGSLGNGSISNNVSIVFTRTNGLTVANAISGNGSLTQNGIGILTLSGGNSFTGAVAVVQGTVRVDNNSALGDTNGITTVSSGATLDLGTISLAANGLNLTNEIIVVSGAGVGGNGAVINSSAVTQQNAVHFLTLAGDTTIGGPGDYTVANNPGRWDIRNTGGPASLSTGGQPFNLTKVGRNQFTIVNADVDANLANITIQAGSFGLQGTTPLGNPANTLTVYSNALLHLNAVTLASKVLVLQDGASVDNTGGTLSTFGGPVTLNGSNSFNVTAGTLAFTSSFGGSGRLYKLGATTLSLAAANSFTGDTFIRAGTLALTASGTLPSPNITLSGGANLDVSTLNNGGTLMLASGQTLTGGGTNTGNLTAASGSVLIPGDSAGNALSVTGNLELDGNSNLVNIATGLGDDRVSISGSLTLNGLSTVYIAPASPVFAGYIATLFQFGNLNAGGAGNLRVIGPPGYTFSVVDPATTPGLIQIRVDTVGGNDIWRGGASGAASIWDTGTTANWVKNGSASVFSAGDIVEFDDGSLSSLVTLNGSLQAKAVLVNNNTQNYTFAGAGKLTGTNTLSKGGSGTLVVGNSGSNDFTGAVNISGGTLQVGDGAINGNLPGVNIVNNGALVFARSDSVAVPGVISGTGPLTQNGAGVLTLSGVNTFTGAVLVAHGTVRVDGNRALGDTTGMTVVTNGATLDLGTVSLAANALNLTNETIMVSGSGVGGNGAIVNSASNSQNNVLHLLVLAGDTTLGGPGDASNGGNSPGRWDLRTTTGNPASLSTGNQPFNLTKVGGNQITFVDVTVDSYLANIDIRGGTFGIQGSTTLGNNANTLTVRSNALLHLNTLSSTPDKPIVLLDQAVMDSTAGNNSWNGPITLAGSNSFNITGGYLSLNAAVNGAGNLYKIGAATLYLSAANSYTGGTFVNNGTLILGASDAITASPIVSIGAGATLDASGVGGLTLAGGQTLAGSGTLTGDLNAPAGSTVSPGRPIGNLTVSGTATLAGLTVMEIDKATPATNNVLTAQNINLGGTLTVISTNTAVALAPGDSFTLFNGSLSGAFAASNLPALDPQLSWDASQLNASGVLKIVGPPLPVAAFAFAGATGAAPLTVSFTNASTGGAYVSAVWNFGDGVRVTNSNTVVTHTYSNAPSTNTVSLTVITSYGYQSTYSAPAPVVVTGSSALAGQPRITRVQVLGGNITLSGTNIPASAGHTYYVLSQTNVTALRGAWLARATNTFAQDGGFTNTFPAGGVQQFFLLSVPTP